MDFLIVWFRVTVVFILALLISRALGKRQMSQLTFFDFVVAVMVAALGAHSVGNLKVSPFPMWLGILVFAIYGYLTALVTLKFKTVRKYIDGEPTIVIQNGKVLEDNMRQLRLSFQELITKLRQKNVFDIGRVEFAIMETDGQLSVLRKSQFRPATPRDLNVSTSYEGRPIELIVDGKILDQNLHEVHLDQKWLLEQLTARHIDNPRSVSYAVLNSVGQLYIDRYDDYP